MDPRRTTPPDASASEERGATEEDLRARTVPWDEDADAAEDWSARYGPPPPPPPRSRPDFSGFFLLLEGLRRAAPAELQESLRAFIREGLLTLRALIDWYLERLDRPPRKPKVEDIPIDP
jgi:hypothetical protein